MFTNFYTKFSPFLNRTVLEDFEHDTKDAAVADILDMELSGYIYSQSIYIGDGQPRRVSLMAEVILLEAERETAENYVPQPQVGVPVLAL
jgi:hypothetical protein